MKNITALFALSVFLFAAMPLRADDTQEAPTPAKLDAREAEDVKRIEAYLNNLKSVSALFLQVNDNGSLRNGTIAIRRPGKMRVTYDPEGSDFMVADGTFLNMWDAEMKQQTSVPVGSGIGSLILRDKISLSGDVVLTRFVRFPSKIEIDLVSRKEPGEGELTLVFEDKPLQLRQWRVLDPGGHTTGVSLLDVKENVPFPPDTFIFVPPNFGKMKHD